MTEMHKREPAADRRPAVSVVVPFHNEEPNVAACHKEIMQVLTEAGLDFEVIYVDDGSRDGTLAAACGAIRGEPHARVVELRRNFGQSAAMAAGFDHARGDVVVPIDGDLQNDPRDIPALVAKLSEPPGYDVVSGWRKARRDSCLRTVPSRLASWLISVGTKVHLHDYGCTLKAYRRDVLSDVQLYGEMHRFIPALAARVGGRVTEMAVNHRPRVAGRSKYGFGRVFRVMLDLTTVKFMMAYLTRPLYFFGRLGMWMTAGALAVLGLVCVQKWQLGKDMTGNPLLYLSVALGLAAVQVMLMGLMMEVLTRTYHESQGRKPYAVRAVHGGPDPERSRPAAEPPAGGTG